MASTDNASGRSLAGVKVLLIDLSGTLHVGDQPTPGAVVALQRLRQAKIPFRLCSNTTKESPADLLDRLRRIGFVVEAREVSTSLMAARQLVQDRGYRNPLLLLSESAKKSFPLPEEGEHDCVVVGLAPSKLSYPRLNEAFRILKLERSSTALPLPAGHKSPALIATHRARYYHDTDGALSLGPGPFITALEEAAEVKAEIVGKPGRMFYQLSLEGIPGEGGWKGEQVAMVGDDIRADLGEGAVESGFVRVLVKTGKYRAGDEHKGDHPPDLVVESFAAFVDMLLQSKE
ncbi:hypothetical protein DACRYDRAFT_111642 [Dacryopinax primogenitus]|uniref:Haloacid dehalogenase-like hydrolase domain-containing protein 2 n=1 Tax=Dacryopinax primogenitus (strain DJM 731) TaxID=1858805 RepID=M5FRI4_DACPD|nr:uncharacterized protein DACRYDRAFT_111642 [Dacryopinax primogenitus]EJT97599.1 hypothetical protein DACRYDRAFT_111642 [Dacryopinax primogenitus]